MVPKSITDLEELKDYLSKKTPRIITIDGRDGSGKTHLSRQLHEALGGTLLSEDKYRSASLNGLFEFDRLKLIQDIAEGLDVQPIILESCFMLIILKKLGLKPDISVYIKALSATTNEWNDEDELAEVETRDLAIKKVIDFGKSIGIAPSNFRLQMISYHYDFLPQDNSDVVYLRTEVYDPPHAHKL